MRIKALDYVAEWMKNSRRAGDAGFDLYAANDATVTGPTLVSAGIVVEIPQGMVGLVVPRSSMHKRGLTLANTVGVIDSTYRGDVKMALMPLPRHELEKSGGDGFGIEVKRGDKLAQLVVVPYYMGELEFVDELTATTRGEGGFGSTGATGA